MIFKRISDFIDIVPEQLSKARNWLESNDADNLYTAIHRVKGILAWTVVVGPSVEVATRAEAACGNPGCHRLPHDRAQFLSDLEELERMHAEDLPFALGVVRK